MITVNLALLMAEHKTKISQLSRITGLSRTTLTELYYEKSSAISFDTLNKLCHTFGCSISDLLSYREDIPAQGSLSFDPLAFKQQRIIQKLSQDGIAKKCKVSQAAVSQWERGETIPDLQSFITLMQVLNCKAESLLCTN